MKARIDAPFDAVITDVTDALESEGFGVLTDIDVQATFKKKLDEEIDQYRILGACNPPLAHEGITAESDLGALLPCNVVVYEADGEVVVSAVDPNQLIDLADNSALDSIADEVRSRFERVFADLEGRYEDVVTEP
jgi:uncharacterized protein (DUF302 family)